MEPLLLLLAFVIWRIFATALLPFGMRFRVGAKYVASASSQYEIDQGTREQQQYNKSRHLRPTLQCKSRLLTP